MTVAMGGFAVQLAVFALLRAATAWPLAYETAVSVAAAVGHNFVWHQRWTWRDRADGGQWLRRLSEYIAFIGVASILANVAFVWLYARVLGAPAFVAAVLAVGSVAIVNFTTNDRFVFRSRR
jgi:dolichol-phosphate mannosyltransferase